MDERSCLRDILVWVAVPAAVLAAGLAGCVQDDGRMPATRPVAAPSTAPSCPPETQVTIIGASPPSASASASISVDHGSVDANFGNKSGFRWKIRGGIRGYAFTNDGIAFSASSTAAAAPSGAGAPASGGSEYSWCLDPSSVAATWYYTIKLTTPAGTTWSCDPTIVNRASLTKQDGGPLTIDCVVQ